MASVEERSTLTAGPLLSVKDLQVDFHTSKGLFQAVRGVSFDVGPGETLAILGESGSGKSVTASAIMGQIESPPGFIRSGTAMFQGENLLKIGDARRRQIYGSKIAMIYQDPLAALNPVYSVGWQIAETYRIRGGGRQESFEKAVGLLNRVGIPNAQTRANDYPHQFSGGQRQRIMIALALALNPALLIADEPTSSLDVTVQARILNLLKEIQSETGQGLLLITHDLGVVARVADRVAVMQKGQIVETAPVLDIFAAPKHAYTQRLLNSIPGRDGFTAHTKRHDGEVLLEARELHMGYPVKAAREGRAAIKAIDGVSFTLRRGETLGVVGESGSGKSTLARLLLCLEEPTGGSVLAHGKKTSAFRPADLQAFRRNVQAVLQDPTASLNPYMTVGQIIAEPWMVHPGLVPRREWTARAAELLQQVGLEPGHVDRYPHQFSGGQRQRIAIARAIALEPEVIICDEALSALDVSIQAQILDLFKALRERHHFTCIFIGHDLRVIRDFCDRVLVVYRGKVVEEGLCDRIFDAPEHAYTRELIASSPIPDPDAARQAGLQLGTKRTKPLV